MSDLVLYNYFRSSTSYRARIALHHKGLDFEYKPVHLLNNGGEQNSDEYKRLNPAGEVPTLIHKGKAIAQSMAIIQYLDEVFPEKALFPKNSVEKARVLQISEGVNCGHALTNLKTLQKLQKDFSFSEEQKKEWSKHWVNKILESCEKQIKTTAKTYAFGDQVTVADIFIIPQLFSAKRFEVDTTRYPLLAKIEENCLKLEAFKKSHPMNQIDTPAEAKK
jgi:maleylacetoacetate isomerase/maleylpyruvate isomerase